MKVLEKVIQSNLPPTRQDVVWVDTSNPKNPIAKIYLNGKWDAASSESGAIEDLEERVLLLEEQVENVASIEEIDALFDGGGGGGSDSGSDSGSDPSSDSGGQDVGPNNGNWIKLNYYEYNYYSAGLVSSGGEIIFGPAFDPSNWQGAYMLADDGSSIIDASTQTLDQADRYQDNKLYFSEMSGVIVGSNNWTADGNTLVVDLDPAGFGWMLDFI